VPPQGAIYTTISGMYIALKVYVFIKYLYRRGSSTYIRVSEL